MLILKYANMVCGQCGHVDSDFCFFVHPLFSVHSPSTAMMLSEVIPFHEES